MKSVSIGSPDELLPNNFNNPDATASQGFTLLETLVGLTIFAIAMSALFAAYANAVKISGHANDHGRAQVLAQSLLAEAAADRNHIPVSRRGRTNGLAWSLKVRTARGELVAHDAETGFGLYHIIVQVRRPGGNAIRLETLFFARAGT